MKIYLSVGKDGIVEGWSSTPEEGTVKVEVEEDHPVLMEFGKYKYIDGELIRMSEDEIDALYNLPDQPTPEERIEVLECTILKLMMGS